MALSREITAQILTILKNNPQGLSITDIVKSVSINRNTAGRYLDKLLVSGQVEMRHFGMAKMYTLSQRLPVSSVLSLSSDLVLQLDRSLRIIYANDPFLEFLEVSKSDLFGKNIEYTHIVSVFDETYADLLGRIKEGLNGTEWRGELPLPVRGIFFFCRIAPTVLNEGQKGVSVLFEDITGRRRNEELLRESEDRYRTLVEISPDAIILHRNSRIIYANPAALDLLGASHPEEMIGKNILDFVEPDFRDAVRTNIQKDLNGDTTHSIELHLLRLDGTTVIVEGRGVRTSIDGEPAVQVAIRDITERKRAEEALQDSLEKYRTLFNNANDMITLHAIDTDGLPGRYIEVNDVACRRLNYTKKELLSMSPKDIIGPEYRESMQKNAGLLLAKGHATFEMIHMSKDGRRIPVEISAHLFDFGGQKMVLALVRDITERKLAAKALQESEERYRTVFENTGTATVVVEEDTTISLVNAEFEHLTGYTKREIEGKMSWTELVVKEDLGRMLSQHKLRRQSNQSALKNYEFRYITKSGEIRNVLLTIDVIPDTTKAVASLMDITERKMKEEALITSEERYRRLLEQSFDAVVIHKEGKITVANDAAAAIAGASSPDVLIGRSIFDFIHPDFHAIVKERVTNLDEKDNYLLPLMRQKYIRLDGQPVDVEVMSTWFMDKGVPAVQVVFRKIPGTEEGAGERQQPKEGAIKD
jgi:PAS domain S-box-containing protein